MSVLNLCVAFAAANQIHSTTIPLDPAISRALLLVPVKVNGEGPFEFVVDTGNAGDVIVTPELAGNLHLVRGKDVKDVYNVGLDANIYRSVIDSLEVGDIRLGKTNVGVSGAMEQVGKQIRRPVQGNLGYEFLKNYALTIDMKHNQLTLTSGGMNKSGAEFKLVRGMRLIVLPVLVGGKAYTFALDSGASFTCVSNELVAELGLKEGPKFPMNNSDKEKGAMTTLPSFSVGGKEVHDFAAVSAGFLKSLSERTKTKIDGIVGRNFWSQFVTTIDYPHKRVRFE